MNINFLLDENMPFALVEFLINKGYFASHLKQLGKGGIRNGEVYQVAKEKEAWILTRDSDFKSYHKFVLHPIKGIIVMTLCFLILSYMQSLSLCFLILSYMLIPVVMFLACSQRR